MDCLEPMRQVYRDVIERLLLGAGGSRHAA
jgi:hypothetical protein